MGGGIILIPALTLFFGIGQHDAQSINLLVFLPMSIAALIFHFKNKLVDFKQALYLSISGLLGGFLGTNLAIVLDEQVLKKAFGILLILLAVYRLIKFLNKKKSTNAKKQK